MRRALVRTAAMTVATLAVAATTATQALARTGARGPSAAQIHRALAGAERSRYLWATVNVCTAASGHGHGGLMGVRGEMPSLGFASTLSMTVALDQYSSTRHRYMPVRGATAHKTVTLGAFSAHVHQSGAEFPFSADPGLLNATVTFTWTRAGRRLGAATRRTTGGHPQAAFGRPAHHSSATCRL